MVKRSSWTSIRLRKNVAPRRGIGVPEASRPMTPSPQASIVPCSLKSKIPLGNDRQNLERIVAELSECVGGRPSGARPRGLLYQPSRVNHCNGVSRQFTVTHSVSPEGAIESTVGRKGWYAKGRNAAVLP